MKAIQATTANMKALGFDAENSCVIPVEDVDWSTLRRTVSKREGGSNTPYEVEATIPHMQYGEVKVRFNTVWAPTDRSEEDIFGCTITWGWQNADPDIEGSTDGYVAFFTKKETRAVSAAEAMAQTSNDD